MKVADYLKRINFDQPVSVDKNTLRELHKHHLLAVPFEDLDIHWKTPLKMDLESLFQKVIRQNRGGFCYELNYLFYALLKEIGFEVSLLSAKVYNKEGILGPEFDHLALLVELEYPYLVDVGFGDSFMEPLRIIDGEITCDWFKYFKVEKVGDLEYALLESKEKDSFSPVYNFDLRPRTIAEFYPQCDYKQYDEGSHFVKNRICTLPHRDGRNTLYNDKWIETEDGEKRETMMKSEEEWGEVLRGVFGIVR